MSSPYRFSAAQRIALCPGCVAACDGLPDRSGDAAQRGTLKHKALEAHYTGTEAEKASTLSALTPDDVKIVALIIRKTDALIEKHGGMGDQPPRCEVTVAGGGWTGHLDFMCLLKTGAILIIDWKTGFGIVPAPNVNAQLRGYFIGGVFVCGNDWASTGPDSGKFFCAIVDPVRYPEPVEYALSDFRPCTDELEGIRIAAQAPDAPRIPSPYACQYCPALGTSRCKESTGLALKLYEQTSVKDIREADSRWLVSVVRAGKVVTSLCKKAKDEIDRRMGEDAESVPGASFKRGIERRSISDPAELFNRIMTLDGVSEGDLWKSGALTFTFGDLEDLVGKKILAGLLDGIIERKRSKDSVVLDG